MKPHPLKLYRSAAAGLVIGATSKVTRWRHGKKNKFPKSDSLNGDIRGVDVIRVIKETRTEAGLPALKDDDILEALEFAEEAIDAEMTEKAARKNVAPESAGAAR